MSTTPSTSTPTSSTSTSSASSSSIASEGSSSKRKIYSKRTRAPSPHDDKETGETDAEETKPKPKPKPRAVKPKDPKPKQLKEPKPKQPKQTKASQTKAAKAKPDESKASQTKAAKAKPDKSKASSSQTDESNGNQTAESSSIKSDSEEIQTDNTDLEESNGEKEVKSEPADDTNEIEEDFCFICTESVKYYALAPCGHRTCHMCTLRLRALYKTKQCAYCKVEAATVIFTLDSQKEFVNYTKKDTPFMDKKLAVLFETESMRNDTRKLLQHECPTYECDAAFTRVTDLKKHVRETHGKKLCDLCLRFKKVFSREQSLFNITTLQKHHQLGDSLQGSSANEGFTGHPECKFCKTRFYGPDELFKHCREKHEECHLCVKKGVKDQYFKDYEELENHFDEHHYLCKNTNCMEDKFVVFNDEIELKAHEINEHPSASTRQKRNKQGRVDLSLNYASLRDRPSSSSSKAESTPQEQAPVRLSAEDFPDIHGRSVKPPPKEEVEEVGLVSSRAAAFDFVAEILQDVNKMVKFKCCTRQFDQGLTSAYVWSERVRALCAKDDVKLRKIHRQIPALLDDKKKIFQTQDLWNPEETPIERDPHVLKKMRAERKLAKEKKLRGNPWDPPAPKPKKQGHSKTPWASNSHSYATPDTNSTDSFPALPTTGGPVAKGASGESTIQEGPERLWRKPPAKNPLFIDDSKFKRNKKGKQVLFRVGF
ncbi:hypothetical protein BY458DRAFT_552596 [Sporodiniella umbellata]|nr:hypothetical protein BY458DRAFT_552596 [Sporodiniella umbellata]